MLTDEMRELVTAARDILKGGAHDGPCVSGQMGECEICWDTESARWSRLKRALEPFADVAEERS